MKVIYLIGVLLLTKQILRAQNDTLKFSDLDSITELTSFRWVKDSITLQAWADSMKVGIYSKFNNDSLTLKNKIDSLTALNLSTNQYSVKFDSLVAQKQNLVSELETRQQQLLLKTKQKLSNWKQKITDGWDSLQINPRSSGGNLSNAQSISIPDHELPEIPSLSVNDFSEINLSPDLAKINSDLPFVSMSGLDGIQEKISGITDNISGLKEIIAKPDGVTDVVVRKIDTVNEIIDFGEFKNPIEQSTLDNPNEIAEQAKKEAFNHFSGKEQQLHKAMEQISKYKEKYSSVQSIKDLTKKAPNEMKDKPFIERVVPGLSFQYQFRNSHMLDMYIYAGYRLRSKITTGIGWNQRLARDKDNSYWNQKAFIYGPRAFGNYRLGKGFMAHLEVESMNTFVSYSLTDPAIGHREWVWSSMTGLKKEYRITKQLKGTVLVLYSIFDPRHRSPYNARLNTRIGFEYWIKKKQSEKTKTGVH